jgi:hypothetical protein
MLSFRLCLRNQLHCYSQWCFEPAKATTEQCRSGKVGMGLLRVGAWHRRWYGVVVIVNSNDDVVAIGAQVWD